MCRLLHSVCLHSDTFEYRLTKIRDAKAINYAWPKVTCSYDPIPCSYINWLYITTQVDKFYSLQSSKTTFFYIWAFQVMTYYMCTHFHRCLHCSHLCSHMYRLIHCVSHYSDMSKDTLQTVRRIVVNSRHDISLHDIQSLHVYTSFLASFMQCTHFHS